MPSISVVLPAFNAASFIKQTIASILAQTFDDFEILVVDDGSSDATSEIASVMDSRIKVLRQKNMGIALARNTGVAAARGNWIAFIDHDDVWHPQKLAVQREILMSQPDCGIVYGEFRRWDPRMPPVFPDAHLDPAQTVPDLSGFILHRLVQTNWVLLSTALVQRQVFSEVGLFDPKIPPADDWDFVIRASERFRFIKLAQAVALYRVHAGQTSLKLFPDNVEYNLRESALRRLSEVGGGLPDMADINRRQFRALFNYGLAQYKTGMYKDACGSFLKSMRYHRTSAKAALYVGASYARSLIP